MYNLTPRWKKTYESTPPLINANTYLLCGGKVCERPRENCYPFLTSSKLKRSVVNTSFCDKFYIVPDNKKIKGGSSLKSKAVRFQPHKWDDTPGPTSYSPEASTKCRQLEELPPGKGRLYLCHVDLTCGVSAPSIPSKIDENGYDIDCYGFLDKVPPNPVKEFVGPADYDITQCPCCNCEKYHGCNWSNSKTKRFKDNVEDLPGPGTYNLQLPRDPLKEQMEEYREMARLFSSSMRYLDMQEMQLIKDNYPSPASYYPKTYKCKTYPGIHQRPFITAGKRFKSNLEITPAPTDYDVKFPEKRKRILCCPLPYSERFTGNKIDDIPGPGAYNLKSPLQQKLDSKLNKYAAFRAPFNHTSKRSSLVRDEGGPGPTAYDVKFGDYCKATIGSSALKSRVQRFPKKCVNNTEPSDPVESSLAKKVKRAIRKEIQPAINRREKTSRSLN
ncbi:unnamed protein product [Brassicogethes aeneus]|uniref:Uncharacterized protein n=1 Tax=Brassicogethes aeneus TaxID=1431903 RepID=A0A9P0B7H6_BRAAE|nr:unnamed protein product [Brassicogethes aeneus]